MQLPCTRQRKSEVASQLAGKGNQLEWLPLLTLLLLVTERQTQSVCACHVGLLRCHYRVLIIVLSSLLIAILAVKFDVY